MPRPLRIFLCHASQDKPTVWKLYRYLKQHGAKPWLDQADLLPGENWEVEIPRAIDSSDVILVCLSKNSVDKEGYVQKEITFALDKALEKPEGTIFIVPVKLEECDVPRRLNRYQWVDLSRPEGRKRLLMGLNKRANDLGPEVRQITLDDTRLRTTAPKTPKPEKPAIEESDRSKLSTKPEIRRPEEQIVSAPVKEEIKEEPKKEIPAKPFTKLLTPSSLSSNKISDSQGGGKSGAPSSSKNAGKLVPQFNARFFTIGAIILVSVLSILFGGNYLIQNWPTPEPTRFVPSPTLTAPPTKTQVSSTTTPNPPTLTPTPGIGSTMVSEKDGMNLLYVPAGEFTMGSDNGGADEKPIHQVYLDAFWIDQIEVTNEMYALCVLADECDQPVSVNSYTRQGYFGNTEFNDYPVIYVSWEDAKTYCLWVDRRLPTEAEWEKAARGTNGPTYPWGDESPSASLLNYNRNVGDTTEVGAYPDGASVYGALDMAGNVWEWVADWYDSEYYQNSPSSNPLGPDSGQYRVLRGGSWDDDGSYVRSALRLEYDLSKSNYFIGFRCSRSP